MQDDPTLNVNLTRALDESKRLADSIKPGSDRWDVIVVGSGAAGGMAAFQLAMAGVKVLLLEAGRMIDIEDRVPDDGVAVRVESAGPHAGRRAARRRRGIQLSRSPVRLESRVRQVQEGGVVRGQPVHAQLARGRAEGAHNRDAVRVGARQRPRRQDELLGPWRAALRAAAVQRRKPRRLRRRLADLVRRGEAVLRQGRRAARMLGDHRRARPGAGRCVSAALEAELRRSGVQAGYCGDGTTLHSRPRGCDDRGCPEQQVSGALRRPWPVRARLRHRSRLPFTAGAHLSGARQRQHDRAARTRGFPRSSSARRRTAPSVCASSTRTRAR